MQKDIKQRLMVFILMPKVFIPKQMAIKVMQKAIGLLPLQANLTQKDSIQ